MNLQQQPIKLFSLEQIKRDLLSKLLRSPEDQLKSLLGIDNLSSDVQLQEITKLKKVVDALFYGASQKVKE